MAGVAVAVAVVFVFAFAFVAGLDVEQVYFVAAPRKL